MNFKQWPSEVTLFRLQYLNVTLFINRNISDYQTRTGFTAAPVFISASASWNLSICENIKSAISKLNEMGVIIPDTI